MRSVIAFSLYDHNIQIHVVLLPSHKMSTVSNEFFFLSEKEESFVIIFKLRFKFQQLLIRYNKILRDSEIVLLEVTPETNTPLYVTNLHLNKFKLKKKFEMLISQSIVEFKP